MVVESDLARKKMLFFTVGLFIYPSLQKILTLTSLNLSNRAYAMQGTGATRNDKTSNLCSETQNIWPNDPCGVRIWLEWDFFKGKSWVCWRHSLFVSVRGVCWVGREENKGFVFHSPFFEGEDLKWVQPLHWETVDTRYWWEWTRNGNDFSGLTTDSI